MLFAAEKLTAKSNGSLSVDKWFSSDHNTKSAKKPVDFRVEPECTITSVVQSGGIWGNFDCDSVPDAVLLSAAEAVEQCESKVEHNEQEQDGEQHFPGRGQKLSEAADNCVPVESIVRRIPGVGVISSHSVTSRSELRNSLSTSQTVNATTSGLPHCQFFPDNMLSPRLLPPSDRTVASQSKTSVPPVKYESVADFRKTVGMVLSPAGTEVRVKNFMSVCNHSARPLLNCKDLLVAPRLKTGRLLSDGQSDVAARPVKRLRSDIEDAKSKNVLSSDTKNLASHSSGQSNNQLQQNVEELNTYDSNIPSVARGVLRSSPVEEMGSAHIDQVIGGISSSLSFEQTDTVDCPVCQVPIPASAINEHLDLCLA